MLVVTLAAMTGRVASVERVYEPSLHRPEPRGAAAGVVAALAGATPVGTTTLLAAAERNWLLTDADAPTRLWPATRPYPVPMFGSNDRSRWATIRALVEDGTFVIGRRV